MEELDTQLDYDRDDRVMKVSKFILSEIAAIEDLQTGMVPKGVSQEEFTQKVTAMYKDMSFKILKEMMDNGVRMSDMKYLFSVTMKPIDTIESMISTIVNAKYDTALAQTYGVEDINDISLANIEEMLVAQSEARNKGEIK